MLLQDPSLLMNNECAYLVQGVSQDKALRLSFNQMPCILLFFLLWNKENLIMYHGIIQVAFLL